MSHHRSSLPPVPQVGPDLVAWYEALLSADAEITNSMALVDDDTERAKLRVALEKIRAHLKGLEPKQSTVGWVGTAAAFAGRALVKYGPKAAGALYGVAKVAASKLGAALPYVATAARSPVGKALTYLGLIVGGGAALKKAGESAGKGLSKVAWPLLLVGVAVFLMRRKG